VRAVVALLLGATAAGAAAPQDDAASIRAALAAWTADFNARRAERVCDIFAPDLRFDVRGAPPDRGFSEMCSQLRRALGDPTRRYSYAVDIKEVLVAGDLAIVRLTWHSTLQVGASEPVESDEPGLDVFARQPDGRWKIIRYLAYEA
jgi:steroid delta-isomerase